jgi:phospholipase C
VWLHECICRAPDGALQGHPGSGKVSLLEDFIQNIVDRTKANPKLFAETAIIVAFDESGGLYDSGFIQPLDFFGDGPRMPMHVISPFSTGGRVVHSYDDQASVLKFIERNWSLNKISNRSRDNLPNPVMSPEHPWVPLNMPAIGDLYDMFDFSIASIVKNEINNVKGRDPRYQKTKLMAIAAIIASKTFALVKPGAIFHQASGRRGGSPWRGFLLISNRFASMVAYR